MSEASEVDLVVQEAKKLWRGRLGHPELRAWAAGRH